MNTVTPLVSAALFLATGAGHANERVKNALPSSLRAVFGAIKNLNHKKHLKTSTSIDVRKAFQTALIVAGLLYGPMEEALHMAASMKYAILAPLKKLFWSGHRAKTKQYIKHVPHVMIIVVSGTQSKTRI